MLCQYRLTSRRLIWWSVPRSINLLWIFQRDITQDIYVCIMYMLTHDFTRFFEQ